MKSVVITDVSTQDVRFRLKPGEGTDAIHTNPQYAYAVARLHTDASLTGVGLALTLGAGTEMVCHAIKELAQLLVGREIEELMADFGQIFRQIADHPQLRWLGPHKGVVHLALASLSNACFDLWAKARGVPLWNLLVNLTPEAILRLLDLSYLEDVLHPEDAINLLRREALHRHDRESVLTQGYPGYDTSIGWFHYSDDQVRENVRRAVDAGFLAMKLKVGSPDTAHDIRRAKIVREVAGTDVQIMLDANQQWTLPIALRTCLDLIAIQPYWIEEPTHPDDVLAHQTLARAISPVKVAVGEHIPNRVLFKNYMQAGAAHFIQVDCTRVGGISEFITVSLLARHFNLPVVPHVGDMGQIHQHLVLFNRVVLGHETIFLEYIPHLRDYFRYPAIVEGGVYRPPQEPGSSSDLLD
ncbi:enolase C-terminal domain-like protein [Roseiflexus sp.]|uniref:enolase C-terminal domain-like protein n=1 Tax=Roseiflexus sp. TaxID=2562120 RepID=UPI00398B6F83